MTEHVIVRREVPRAVVVRAPGPQGPAAGGGVDIPEGLVAPVDPDVGDLWLDTGTESGAPSGTSVPVDWLNVFAVPSAGIALADGVTLEISFDADNDPPPRGTSITWVIGTPTIIGIDDDGTYDVAYRANFNGGTAASKVSAYVVLNDDSVGPLYGWVGYSLAPIGATDVGVLGSVPGVQLQQGDTLKLAVLQYGNANDDTMLFYAGMIVSRRT